MHWIGTPLILIPSLLILLTFPMMSTSAADPASKISPSVQTRLDKGEKVSVVVFFEGGTKAAVDRVKAQRINDRSARNQAIFTELKQHTESAQAGVVQLLSTRSSSFRYFKQYWTSNKVFVKEASAEVIKSIAENAQVSKIIEEPMGKIPPVPETDASMNDEGAESTTTTGKPQRKLWDIAKTQVHEAWDELGGKNGEGVLVGSIDSGVRHTHEALRDNFYGTDYGWYDPFENRPEPMYLSDHGTNTMGKLAGRTKDIGVAPGVRWMACMACDGDGICWGERLMDCVKFFACPTLANGSNPDCSKAPHIVYNSWVVPRGTDAFNEDIMVWRDMGIIPLFAIGNEDPHCNSAQAPAELPFVIGVGATDRESRMAVYSSQGWASDGGVKPDFVSPGDIVLTARVRDDTDYGTERGTSLATPFLAGIVALLKVRNLDLTYDEAYALMIPSASRELTIRKYAYFCNESTFDPVPNVFWGYGEVNALKAVQEQTKLLKKNKK